VILDADEAEDGTAFQADICIAGAGAAGITLALRLIGSGKSVLLLESGGERVEEATQRLCEGEVVDPALHSPPDKYRQRRLGGTTGIWGGRCVPFDAMDFERRPWIAESGWPFGLEELLPYYAEANRICEAGRFAYTVEQAFPAGARPIIRQFRGRRFTDDTLERFSLPTDFGRRYRARLLASREVRVLLHANAIELRTGAAGAVTELQVRTLRGKVFTVRAGPLRPRDRRPRNPAPARRGRRVRGGTGAARAQRHARPARHGQLPAALGAQAHLRGAQVPFDHRAPEGRRVQP
jgi:choline dehydrogenase-like flavoprotein